jgi:hypothetical protein
MVLDVGLDVYHSITCKFGKGYGRKQWKLIALKLIQEIMKLSVEFSAGVTLVLSH